MTLPSACSKMGAAILCAAMHHHHSWGSCSCNLFSYYTAPALVLQMHMIRGEVLP